MNTDYKIEAMKGLLNEDCILARYYPLIPYKEDLVDGLHNMGYRTKSDCMGLSDEALLEAGLVDIGMVQLLGHFNFIRYKSRKIKGNHIFLPRKRRNANLSRIVSATWGKKDESNALF